MVDGHREPAAPTLANDGIWRQVFGAPDRSTGRDDGATTRPTVCPGHWADPLFPRMEERMTTLGAQARRSGPRARAAVLDASDLRRGTGLPVRRY